MTAIEEAIRLTYEIYEYLQKLEAEFERPFRQAAEDLRGRSTVNTGSQSDVRTMLEAPFQLNSDAVYSELKASLDSQYTAFSPLAPALSSEERDLLTRWHRTLVLPFFLRSAFVRRSIDKPFGYAGDYGVVEMIFSSPSEGPSPFATMIEKYVLNTAPPRGHRNRLPWTLQHLRRRAQQVDRPLRLLSVACGPECIIREFVAEGGKCEITLVDADPAALRFAERKLREVAGPSPLTIHSIPLSTGRLLRQGASANSLLEEGAGYDAITVLGLFDYLDEAVIDQLMDRLVPLLLPNGLFLATNLSVSNEWRMAMELVLDWTVIHREKSSFSALLCGPSSRLHQLEVNLDASGTNIFFAGTRS